MFEYFLGSWIAGEIGMMLLYHFKVGRLELLLGEVASDSKQLVVVGSRAKQPPNGIDSQCHNN